MEDLACAQIGMGLYQSQIYFLSRINAPAKRFGYTLTN